MKSPFVVRAMVLAGALLIAASSALSQVSIGIGVQIGPPPPPRYERMGPAPYHQAVWIRGHWMWDDYAGRYVWTRGYWAPARPAYVWMDGGWHQGPRGWGWREGYWKHRGNGYWRNGPGSRWASREPSYDDRGWKDEKHQWKGNGRGGRHR